MATGPGSPLFCLKGRDASGGLVPKRAWFYAEAMQVKLLDLVAQYAPLREEIRSAIDAVCDSQALILGPFVDRFEKKLAAYCGVKHAIGVTSGTDALLLSMMAIGIKPGDEVICPAFTFFATAGSVARLGAKPVFVDIEPDSFNMNPDQLKAAITRKTRAIIPVHLFGQLAKMEAVNDIACKHDLLVIEDAAQAIGARRFGKAACAWICGLPELLSNKKSRRVRRCRRGVHK